MGDFYIWMFNFFSVLEREREREIFSFYRNTFSLSLSLPPHRLWNCVHTPPLDALWARLALTQVRVCVCMKERERICVSDDVILQYEKHCVSLSLSPFSLRFFCGEKSYDFHPHGLSLSLSFSSLFLSSLFLSLSLTACLTDTSLSLYRSLSLSRQR